mgnify:CR=1 FL=1
MRQIEKSLHRKIKARLYLYAVLPVFEEFLAESGSAREALGTRAFTLSFQTTSGLKSYLQFKCGSCTVTKTSSGGADIVLHFLSENHLNKEFENEGFRIPIPLRGASRIGDLRTFKTLTKLLEQHIRPDELQLQDPAFHQAHVALQLGIALRAGVELIQHEPRAQSIIGNTPPGIAHFCVGTEGYSAWVSWINGRIQTGKGTPVREPDVRVTFKDGKTALKAVGNQIDVFAAIGLRDITIEGLVPLADALGYIFERIPIYIKP